jgi:hypothetical protein
MDLQSINYGDMKVNFRYFSLKFYNLEIEDSYIRRIG